MSAALAGGLVGLAFAVVEYFLFGVLIGRAAGRNETGRGPRILDLVRKAQLVLFPLAGFLLGTWLGSDSGVS